MRKATDEAKRSPESRVRFRRRLVQRSLTLDLVFHTETFAFDDHRLGVMQQPIQDGGGQRVVLIEDLRPLLNPTATFIYPCFVAQRFTDASETTGPHHRQPQTRNFTWANFGNVLK